MTWNKGSNGRQRSNGRTSIGACGMLLLVGAVAPPARAQVRDWNTVNGDFYNAANWSPNIVPAIGDLVRIGVHPTAENGVVTLDNSGLISSLEITDGMRLRTHGEYLIVAENTTVSGQNDPPGPGLFASRLHVFGGAVGPGYDFSTGTLTLTNGGHTTIESGGRLDVMQRANIHEGSTLGGNGTLRLYGNDAVALSLDGNINAWQEGLTISQLGTGLIDLDGQTGSGHLELLGAPIGGSYDHLTINGTTLADTFSGSMALVSGAVLNMNLADGWTADENSRMDIAGSQSVAPARIVGGDLDWGGLILLYGENAHVRFEADTTLLPTADINISFDDAIDFTGEATVLGGNFDILNGGELNFHGPTTVRGGDFETHSAMSVNGAVNFNGATAWDGTVDVEGIARQVGNATVTGPTVLNATVLDMDGDGGTQWVLGNNLVINAESIDSTVSNTFDGTLQITGGFAPKLSVNIADSSPWTMAGTMHLAGSPAAGFPIERIAGTPMRVTGDVHVDYRVRIAADTTFDNGSTVDFADPSAVLHMAATSEVTAGATFTGQGTFRNDASGVMTLADGVSLDEVSLRNEGLLHIGEGAAIATVGGFANGAAATWLVQLGGYAAGSEHDLLLVSEGGAVLAGLLEVELLEAGSDLFAPQIGDEFTVLTSLDGVSGQFAGDPVTHQGGLSYWWSVLYDSHEVTLRLESITPEPASFALLLLGGVTLLTRRPRPAIGPASDCNATMNA